MIPIIAAFERSPDGGKEFSPVRRALQDIGRPGTGYPVSFAAMRAVDPRS